MKKNDESIREMWEAIKYTNKHVVEVPEWDEREKGAEKYMQKKIIIMEENSPTLLKNNIIHI